MYGLVNKAVEDLVTSKFGQDSWDQIRRKAGLQNEGGFVRMNAYPDAVTYDLVAAASEVLGLTGEQVLEAFGEHWTVYTAQEGYGPMLDLAGSSLIEFLENLDQLHARVGMSFPQLRPPSFSVTDVTADSARLHYTSERVGLAPLVVGLLRGLGKRFGQRVEITHDRRRGVDSDHDEFLITFAAV